MSPMYSVYEDLPVNAGVNGLYVCGSMPCQPFSKPRPKATRKDRLAIQFVNVLPMLVLGWSDGASLLLRQVCAILKRCVRLGGMLYYHGNISERIVRDVLRIRTYSTTETQSMHVPCNPGSV
eukprot:351737-Chlamydomonas_euryale.AAC.8